MEAGAQDIQFAALARLGVGTRSGDTFGGGMPLSVARDIVDLPGRYPTSWVDLAERTLSSEVQDESLSAVALSNDWVPEVPLLQARTS